MKKSSLALKIILPLLVIAIGVAGLRIMNQMKPSPQRQPAPEEGLLVDILTLQAGPQQVTVQGTGTVQPAREIQLVPQVSGKVTWISPRLVNGGFFRTGETLLKIDDSDYRLAVDKARADIASAEVSLATEQERAKVARAEWERINLPDKGRPGPLVTREIQVRQQQANLEAARANLRQAELNLQRTTLKAPFAARIRAEQVDLGQYLRAGTSIATLAGTERAEIHVPLPAAELQWLKLPDSQNGAGTVATITLPGDSTRGWKGRIVRTAGEISADSRMATVVVSVRDPYNLQAEGNSAELPHGQFVDVILYGPRLDNAVSIPRRALRPDSIVWIADEHDRLWLQQVEILRREKDQVLIEEGLAPGDRVVLTTISGAANGMLLRPVEQEQAPQ